MAVGPHLLVVVPCFAHIGLIHPRHAPWNTYLLTWRATPFHLLAEKFESGELCGPLHCYPEMFPLSTHERQDYRSFKKRYLYIVQH